MGIHLVMPMGGGGTRFNDKGFNLPKPLIELQGKPFFYWATQSIAKFVGVEDIIFVVLQEHIDRFEIRKKIHCYYPDAKIQVIPQMLNGAVLTCCEGIKTIHDDHPILFNDCDHAFICKKFYSFAENAIFEQPDGALLTFNSHNPNFSYVRFGKHGEVIGTIEKSVASNEAICGAYYFRNKDIFMTAVNSYLTRCAYKEFFLSGVYNMMAEHQKTLVTFPVDEHISFGTPDEYDVAISDARLKVLK